MRLGYIDSLWIPAPFTGVPTLISLPHSVHVPISIDRRSLDLGRLPAMPSFRPASRALSASASQGRIALVTPRITLADSPSSGPGRWSYVEASTPSWLLSRRDSLLCLLPSLLGLSWSQSHGEVLVTTNDNFRSSLKFHHLTSMDHSWFASTGALLSLGRHRSWHSLLYTMGWCC